ncbi:ABC transporter permease [Marinomonas rhizomae]|uniref:ABC transporter permease subunit n=1 Tax=Marinomonas rhizomae TaxID=491948 RepID=UPI00210253FB|nr:ABC transporter permease [Marinomonas rhizomae]UTV98064.1 ABC transporter permease [Marinomonas rhizomae]
MMGLNSSSRSVVVRGQWASIILLLIFVISCAAPWLANDKPLLIHYQDKWFFPTLESYPETSFGGVFSTQANYKDPFVAEQIESNGWWLWAPIRYSYQSINYDVNFPSPPTSENWLGVDDQGRDVLARLLYGIRISLLFSFGLTALVALLALFFGGLQGYYGGKADLLGQRFSEVWATVPVLFIVMIVASLIQPGPITLMIVLALFGWHHLAQQVRAEVLKVRQLDYVQAALLAGIADFRIIYRHIFPNALVATLSNLPFVFSGALGALITLDFLGFGLPTGYPSLGELLAQGKNNIQAPWLGAVGCTSVLVLVVLVVLVGEALQEKLATIRSRSTQIKSNNAEGEAAC